MAGNANSGRKLDKHWTEALRLEGLADDRKKLRQLAKIVWAQALSGDATAWQEIGNRFDGRPTQSVEVDQTIEHKYVRAPAKASDDEWKQTLLMKTASGKPNADHKVN